MEGSGGGWPSTRSYKVQIICPKTQLRMPRPSRMGAQCCPLVTAGPTCAWEAPRPHIRLTSPPKHRGTTSSGPTNSAELTTRASMASLPGLRSTHATSRPLNSRTRTAARRRGRASEPSCGSRRFRGELAFTSCVPYCRVAGTIILVLLSATPEFYPAVCSLLGLLGDARSLTHVRGRRIIQIDEGSCSVLAAPRHSNSQYT